MKLIKPSFEILSDLDSISKNIERAARTCYKSEANITDASADIMLKSLIKNKHTAMLEHGTVYLIFEEFAENNIVRYIENPYSFIGEDWCYVTTNYRVLVENNWLDDLEYQCEPTDFHEKRISVKFLCDRGISHELVRHRVFSFAQESTRYCNYSKEQFGNELTFIKPFWITDEQFELVAKMNERNAPYISNDTKLWYHSTLENEQTYLSLLKEGWAPQAARSILPNSLKTEIVMTGTISQWKEFFTLRSAPSAHPQMRELSIPLEEQFKNLI